MHAAIKDITEAWAAAAGCDSCESRVDLHEEDEQTGGGLKTFELGGTDVASQVSMKMLQSIRHHGVTSLKPYTLSRLSAVITRKTHIISSPFK